MIPQFAGLVQYSMRHFGEIEFSVDVKTTGKNTYFKIQFQSEVEEDFLWKKQDT